jgi:hypothetical protein
MIDLADWLGGRSLSKGAQFGLLRPALRRYNTSPIPEKLFRRRSFGASNEEIP